MESVVNRAATAVSRALERPLSSVEETGPRSARATVAAGRNKHRLELRWVGRGWPADLEHVLHSVRSPWPRQLVVVGQRFSPGALEQLAERDANWVDEAGAARVETPSGLLVVRDAREDAATAETSQGFRWASSSAEIAE